MSFLDPRMISQDNIPQKVAEYDLYVEVHSHDFEIINFLERTNWEFIDYNGNINMDEQEPYQNLTYFYGIKRESIYE